MATDSRPRQASFYFICLFGLRGIFALLMGPGSNTDLAAMQQQMMGAGAPKDPAKAFQGEAEALYIAQHSFALEHTERNLARSLRTRRGKAE